MPYLGGAALGGLPVVMTAGGMDFGGKIITITNISLYLINYVWGVM